MRPVALTRDERRAPTRPSPLVARWSREVLLDRLCLIDRSTRPLRWAYLAAGRLRLDRLCRNGAGRLSSPGLRPFLAKQESLPAAILRCAPACAQVRRRSPAACRSPSRPQWCGLEADIKENPPWRPSAPSRSP